MISARPHTFFLKSITESEVDSEGALIHSDGQWGDSLECRIVTGGKENIRYNPEGGVTVYPFVVYCDVEEDITGRSVKLIRGEEEHELQVKACQIKQLNTMLFL